MYTYVSQRGRIRVPTREAWLEAMRQGLHRPKPPEWWLATQEREEHRDRRTASIIWGSRYDNGRRYLQWCNAPLGDFIALGYFEG